MIQMKNKIKAIFLATLGMSAIGCAEKAQVPQAQTPILDVVAAEVKEVVGYNSFPATIQGEINNDIRAKIQGYIQEVYVHEGQVVTKGNPLFGWEANNLEEKANLVKSVISFEKEKEK